MKHKLALALIPIIGVIGAPVLLWDQPYSNYNLLSTNAPIVNDLVWRFTNGTIYVSNAWPPILRYYNREVFVGDQGTYGPGPTNIVISNDYSGTIQIGSNFATVQELDIWVSMLGAMNKHAQAWPTKTNASYTVDVANGLWTHTNVIDIHRCSEFCTRMRYVENGLTNDFHAAFVSYTVKTNAP